MTARPILLALVLIGIFVLAAAPAAEARGPGGSCRLTYREHTIAASPDGVPDVVVYEPYLECYY